MFAGTVASILLFSVPRVCGEDFRPTNPLDSYVAISLGAAIPFKTDVTETGPGTNLEVRDVSLRGSLSLGAKLGAYSTAYRAQTGYDFGVEADVTLFLPDQKSGTFGASGTRSGVPVTSVTAAQLNLSTTIYAVNLLIRKPMGVSEAYPNGRWFPYVGIGGGAQRIEVSGGRDGIDPVGQVLAGAKLMLGRHWALFGEYKFSHATQKLAASDFSPNSTDTFHFNVNHINFGLAWHF